MTHFITVPDAPPIPGLTFRRYRDEADIATITHLINTTRRADGSDHLLTVEHVANAFAHTPGFDPSADVLIVEVDGRPIGSSRVWWAVNGEGQRIHFSVGAVLPEWRGRGIGAAVLHHNQRRLHEIASGIPGNAPRFFDAWAADTETHCQRMLMRDGFQPLTYWTHMLRPDLDNIPDVPTPAGLEVRPVLPEHMRAVWEADEEAFQDHWGNIPGGEEGYQKFLGEAHDPSLWRVAWAGDQVAGQVRSFINADENAALGRQRGYTENISTRRPWRRLGLARALIALSLAAIKARGMSEAALSVHTDNPNGALQLYESVGFAVTRRFTIFRKPMD